MTQRQDEGLRCADLAIDRWRGETAGGGRVETGAQGTCRKSLVLPRQATARPFGLDRSRVVRQYWAKAQR